MSRTLLKIQSVRSCSHYTHRCRRIASRVISRVTHISSLPHLVFFSHSSDVVIKEYPGLSVILFAWTSYQILFRQYGRGEFAERGHSGEFFGINGDVSKVGQTPKKLRRLSPSSSRGCRSGLLDIVNRNRVSALQLTSLLSSGWGTRGVN